MGRINEIQKESTLSYGGNTFTTTIEGNEVIMDTTCDQISIKDKVSVFEIKIGNALLRCYNNDFICSFDNGLTWRKIALGDQVILMDDNDGFNGDPDDDFGM